MRTSDAPGPPREPAAPPLELPRAYNAASHFLDRHLAEGRGAKVAIRDDTANVTYAELVERANRAGNALRSLGVGLEQRVALLLLDSAQFPAVFFGAMKLGAVPVPLNTLLTAHDYDYMLRDSRAKVLVVSPLLLEKVAPILAGQPFLEHVLVDDPEGDGLSAPAAPSASTPARASLPAAMARSSPALAAAPTSPDDVGFWLYTSGSTGQPKAAVHLHGDLAHTVETYGKQVLGIREDDVVFSAAKLFFAYGLGNAMSFPLGVGATAVLMAERPTPAAVIRRLREHSPTIFCGVPTLYASLLTDAALPEAGEHRLRRCISAGEALPAEVGKRWLARMGVDILDGIGSTEMLHIFVSNRPGDVRYGTTGSAVPGYEARLVDEHGHDVGPGEVGDLLVSGPSSATSYWNKRALSLRTFAGRWTRTGDRYRLDAHGRYVYEGRSDDMLKVGGIYVSPFEVEGALVSHAAVLEAAVVGHADRDGLIKPKAFVLLKPGVEGGEALVAELKAHVKELLAPFKYPRWIELVADLPRTATGKIQRFKLR